MKKFKSASFVDYKGDIHTVTVCLVCFDAMGPRMYSLGWSCSNPQDTHDKDTAEDIAFDRAALKWKKASDDIITLDIESCNNIIQVSRPGFVLENFDEFTDMILNMYLKYLIKHPAIMIKGYNHEARKYREKANAFNTLSKMSKEEIDNMKSLASASSEEIEANKKLYKYYEQIK